MEVCVPIFKKLKVFNVLRLPTSHYINSNMNERQIINKKFKETLIRKVVYSLYAMWKCSNSISLISFCKGFHSLMQTNRFFFVWNSCRHF